MSSITSDSPTDIISSWASDKLGSLLEYHGSLQWLLTGIYILYASFIVLEMVPGVGRSTAVGVLGTYTIGFTAYAGSLGIWYVSGQIICRHDELAE